MPYLRILSVLALIASTAAARSFTLGGGMNFSTMNIEENEEAGTENATYSLRPGFNAGMGLEFYLSPRFALSPGLILETRGQGVKVDAPDTTGLGVSGAEIVFKLLYLQMPLHLRAVFPVGRQAGLHLFAGPELGISLSSQATVKAEFMGQSVKSTQSTDSKTFDVGVSFGAGFRMPVGTMGVFLEPSYYYGFVDVALPDDDEETPDVDESKEEFHSQNRNFKVRAGIYRDF